MRYVDFKVCSTLEESLHGAEDVDFPDPDTKEGYISRLNTLESNFSNYPVEMGAMADEINRWVEKIGEALKIEDEKVRAQQLEELFDDDPCLFLNRHGKLHVEKVKERALDILKCFPENTVTYYELFILLCAINVHDIGNILGRKNHEKALAKILERDCKNIIRDSVERLVVSKIAGAHGGSIRGDKDTISKLDFKQKVRGCSVNERLLAAVLRFADELADDATRASQDAIDNGILGDKSKIYHIYSSSLHGVELVQNQVSKGWDVELSYKIDRETADMVFKKGDADRYLLDEIYDRTLKMERERRYCNRFFQPLCTIEQINVEIVFIRDIYENRRVTYTLHDFGYPDKPYSSILEVDDSLMSGSEMAELLKEEDAKKNEYS